jgi:hypothetical protein
MNARQVECNRNLDYERLLHGASTPSDLLMRKVRNVDYRARKDNLAKTKFQPT